MTDKNTMKYIMLTNETKVHNGVTLYRIQSLKDFSNVKAGDKGGWIEKESNLSQCDNAWIYDNAIVCGNAKVYENAKVYGNAMVCGNAIVYGNAWICGNAWIYDYAKVYGDAKVAESECKKWYDDNKNWNQFPAQMLSSRVFGMGQSDE